MGLTIRMIVDIVVLFTSGGGVSAPKLSPLQYPVATLPTLVSWEVLVLRHHCHPASGWPVAATLVLSQDRTSKM